MLTTLIIIISVDATQYHRVIPVMRNKGQHYLQSMTNYIIDYTEENSKIFIISQNTSYVVIPIYANYYINPRRTNFEYFNLPVQCDDCEKENNIKNILLDYDYLYIYNTTPILQEKYQFLKNVEDNQLYKIKESNNYIELEKIGSISQYNSSQTPGSGS